MAITLDGTNGITTPDLNATGEINADIISNEAGTGAPNFPNGLSVNSNPLPTAGSFGNRNKIINGAMVIDQRNAGSAVTLDNTASYTVDRWLVEDGSDAVLSVQQSTDVPSNARFANSLKVTATTADASIGAAQFAVITQIIEGFNAADFGFGTSNATSVTVSFWVKATVAGQYSCTLYNGTASRINPQAFTIASSNTWEYKTITFEGDTTGTWLTNNGRGIVLNFYIALGSNSLGSAGWNGSSIYGVTGQANALASTNDIFAITGVQLEVGDTATPFEHRSYGQELALCQRYYQTSYVYGTAVDAATGPTEGASFVTINTSDASNGGLLPVTMRATPTFAMYSTIGGSGSPSARDNVNSVTVTGITLIGGTTTSLPRLNKSGGLSPTGSSYSAHYTASAEL